MIERTGNSWSTQVKVLRISITEQGRRYWNRYSCKQSASSIPSAPPVQNNNMEHMWNHSVKRKCYRIILQVLQRDLHLSKWGYTVKSFLVTNRFGLSCWKRGSPCRVLRPMQVALFRTDIWREMEKARPVRRLCNDSGKTWGYVDQRTGAAEHNQIWRPAFLKSAAGQNGPDANGVPNANNSANTPALSKEGETERKFWFETIFIF